MKKFEWFRTWLAAYTSRLWQRVGGKTVGVVVALTTLILFGDTLLPLLGHVLHVLIEVIESVLEHFLESVFDLSPRQAQVILFYSGLAIAIYLLWYLSRKAYFTALHAYSTVQVRRRAIAESAKIGAWIRIALMISTLRRPFIFSPNSALTIQIRLWKT